MKTKKFVLSVIIALLFFSCQNNTGEGAADDNQNTTNLVVDSASIVEAPQPKLHESESASIVLFDDLSVSIDRLINVNNKTELAPGAKSDVLISAVSGETIEGQEIVIISNTLTNLKVEQRYQTSITVEDGMYRCDLEWRNYLSDWVTLNPKPDGTYEGAKYSPYERERFPEVTTEELRGQVLSNCGDDWKEIVQKISTPIARPCSVLITHYFLRISGQDNNTGKTISKTIEIFVPTGS